MIPAPNMKKGAIGITPAARRYALQELCRRAGLLGHEWRVEHSADRRTLTLISNPAASAEIDFPAFDEELDPALCVQKSWPFDPPVSQAAVVPNFIIPYARTGSIPGQPLFLEISPHGFRCTEDLLASIVLVLSRFEEIHAQRHDEHGRSRAVDSLAVRDGYLQRPIVDEYALALQQLLQTLIPAWTPPPRALRVKLSHDIDEVGIPFTLRETAGHLLHRAPKLALHDLLSLATETRPGNLVQVVAICLEAKQRGLHSALYWKASAKTSFDSGYDLADSRVREVIEWARNHDLELGVHPGYQTFQSPPDLAAEVSRCRTVLGPGPIGGRQHYLRWSPETWQHWEQCGLAYDSTVGYADRVGFRAGTCWPYAPWLWNQDRPAHLLEIPLVVMDRTLAASVYMSMTPGESLAALRKLLRNCQAVGGVFTLLWHNSCLTHPWSAYYPQIFDELSGLTNYDWKPDFKNLSAMLPASQ